MNSRKVRHVIAWFRKADWADIKKLCAPNDLQDSYEQWLADVQAGMQKMGVTEDDIEKSILTPDDLRKWKAANSGEIDSRIRARLAIELARERTKTIR